MLECPHCHRTVLPTIDWLCPGCQGDFHDRGAVDPDVEVLAIYENSTPPERCCTCGEYCTRRVQIRRSQELSAQRSTEQSSSPASAVRMIHLASMTGLILILFGAIGRMFSSGRSRQPSSTLSIDVSVTQCKNCSREQPIEPVRVNYDQCYIQVSVRREYAEDYRTINA